jgi:hypothetical protein
MSYNDAGVTHARLAAALNHVLADVLRPRHGPDPEGRRLAALGNLSLEPGQVRATLDLEGVEAVVDQRLEEA